MQILKRLSLILLALSLSISALSMNDSQADSLVILMSSKSAQMVDVKGASYRKVIGPARFLHNNTYLLCDTALWNVEKKIIEAWGNVSVLQEETVLTSDKLTYLIDEDLAQFRGTLVQLEDKDHNTLRTRHLDYNTKDSVAVFQRGGAMRDKDGQIIESRNGTYDSKINTFTFEINVNMFTDSIFVKTNNLVYQSDLNLATFSRNTNAWQEKNMLSSDAGWYDRNRELFFFTDKVHVMSEDQEGWCDSLFFHRMTSDVEMYGNAQVMDTTRNVFGLAGKIGYVDSLSRVTMTRDPAVISRMEEQDGSIDTVYLGADRLVYYTIRKCDIDSVQVEIAESRVQSLNVDPVGEFRKKAAEAAAKAAAEAAMNDPNQRAKAAAMQKQLEKKAEQEKPRPLPALPTAPVDSLASADSLAPVDSLMPLDSVVVEEVLPDTTKIGFLEAVGNVRIFKKSMQVRCDSLLYCDLDSLARMYKEPLIWQETVRQYSADSVSVVVRNNRMDKASLMSNAFITIQEDSSHFDQIKGTEMLAFFDDKGGLKRFDVLGGASALFYIEENDILATVNKPESKMLSATFRDGEIQRIYYFEEAKNDASPLALMSEDELKLKGFNWQPERRPADRNAVTPLSLRPSERKSYSSRPKATFVQTDKYFPGYMGDIYRQIEVRDSLRIVREREARIARRQAAERARLDSLARIDSLSRLDSLARLDSIALADSLKKAFAADSLAKADSLKAVKDSLAALADTSAITKVLTPEEEKAALKAAKKEEREKKRAEKKAAREAAKKKRQEAREARWAELDRRDAEKQKAKEEKQKKKERERKRKAIEAAAEEARRDAEILEKYRQKYQQRKDRR